MEYEAILERIFLYRTQISRKKFLWILLGIIFAILLGIFAVNSTTYYSAVTVFHPDSGGSPGGNIASNPIAMLLSGQSGASESGLMIGALKSRNLSESVTRDSVCYKDGTFLVADLVLEESQSGFSLSRFFRSLFFDPPPERSKESKVISAASLIRYSVMVETNEQGYILFHFSSTKQDLTEIISELYIAKLREYYKFQKTSKAQKNIEFFTQRADSVRRELEIASRSLARYQDRNKYRIYSEGEIYVQEQTVKLEMLKQMYTALIINREQAVSQKLQKTPFIQVLDFPAPPFRKSQRSVPLYIFLGLILGIILGMVWACRKLIKGDIIALIKQSMQSKPSSVENPFPNQSLFGTGKGEFPGVRKDLSYRW